MKSVAQHNMGTTVFYITHDQRAALQLGDRIAIMDPQGELVQVGSDEDIILRPRTRFVFEFIGVTNFLALKRVDGQYRGSGQYSWPLGRHKCLRTAERRSADVGIRPVTLSSTVRRHFAA